MNQTEFVSRDYIEGHYARPVSDKARSRPYRVCMRCVMDTSDERIAFDEFGVCDHCRSFDRDVKPNWQVGPDSEAQLQKTIDQIKESRRGEDFDCLLGLSGGLDSSYMLHMLVEKFGLRPLVFHVDGGWNTDLATSNIQSLVDGLGLDLYTEVINWREMRDLQLAFFRSGVPHLDIPQDHAFIATLYHYANKHGVPYIMNGGNYSTECVRNPLEWLYYGTDLAQMKDIHGRFGSMPLKDYPLSSIFFHKMYLPYVRGVKMLRPLNSMPYSKKIAIDTLSSRYGWRSYPQKHFESRFTRFFEGFWLPTRFGYDTRRVQYSSLILTGQMERDEALQLLARIPYAIDAIQDDIVYVAKKLQISTTDFMAFHTLPIRSYRDYRNQHWVFDLGAKVLKAVGVERAIKR